MNVENNPPAAGAIKFLTGPLTGKSFQLFKPITTIGRDPTNDIVVFDPKVSRSHARITQDNGTWRIENLSQKSIVLVNQSNVQQAILQHNARVNLGDDSSFVFLMQAPVPVAPQSWGIPGSGIMPAVSPVAPSSPGLAAYSPTPVGALARHVAAGAPAEKTMWAGQGSLEVSSNLRREKKVHQLSGQQPVSIGRNPANEIVIDELVVSSFHAQIVREGNKWVLIHPHPIRGNTLNGLLYQGRLIRGNEQFRKILVHGDIFRIGDEHGTLVTLTFDSGIGQMLEAPPEIHSIPFGEPIITLGRAPDNRVVLNHPLISAHHARLEQIPGGGYRILDLNSTNHVYVNGQLITYQILKDGDEIRIGPYRFVYTPRELTQHDESSSIRIDAINLVKVGNNNVVLLNDISLVIPPRKFVALVGGSGAGKSTLMDALNGLRPAQQGTVLYNGQDYYKSLASFNTQLGYVPQDDIVHRDLTVDRALCYAARSRWPSDFTKEQIQWRIDEVLEDVEMTERRKLLVSKLSGGQRKRVSIALELLANPSIFFLDEPTSGLDPGLDRKMMYLLRRLADRGRTIVLVTHATNNINACDYVCFLARGGRVAYFGPPNEAKAFFNKTDFAEIYSTLEPTKDNPNIAVEAEARFKASVDYTQFVKTPLNDGQAQGAHVLQYQQIGQQQQKRGNPWMQFMLLSMRYIELLKNDVGTLAILLVQAPIIALVLTLMVHYQVGGDVFATNKIVQCQTQIVTNAGPLALPEAQTSPTTDCDNVKKFLSDSHNRLASDFVQHKGNDVDKALQDFIARGPGADAQTVLFIMAFATVLFGCINGSGEIVKEEAIYRRERAVNLGIMPYMFSKIVVLGVLCLVQSAVLIAIVYLGMNFLQKGVIVPIVPEVYITLALTSLVGLMLGLTISAIASNKDRANSFVPIILIPQVIFSGTLIPLKDSFTQAISVVFPTRWAMAALGSSMGLHGDKIGDNKLFGDDYAYHGTLFSTFTHADAANRIVLAWGALVVLTIVLTILMAVFLKRKDVRG